LQHDADIPYADSLGRSDGKNHACPRKASLISHFMVCDKPTTALGAEVILFTVVFFPVSGYVRIMAMGALDFYGY
jgi:hypothetical protein